MFKTVLAPVDGSDTAGHAARYAGDLAAKYGAKLILFHAIHYPRGRLPEELHRYAVSEHLDQADEIGAVVAKILSSAEVLAREAGAGDIVKESKEGEPAQLILAAAKSYGADLIVIGHRGLGTMQGLLLGSVSHKVLYYADVPVMIVR